MLTKNHRLEKRDQRSRALKADMRIRSGTVRDVINGHVIFGSRLLVRNFYIGVCQCSLVTGLSVYGVAAPANLKRIISSHDTCILD